MPTVCRNRWLVTVFREDRILDEIHATGGDIRRAADMFGLTIPPLLRYLATLNNHDLDARRVATRCVTLRSGVRK